FRGARGVSRAHRLLERRCARRSKTGVTMENQHRHITGYRDLSQSEIDIMNEVKQHGESCRDLLERVKRAGEDVDGRWVSIAQTHFQQGYMALVRAIAKPTTF